MKPDPTPTSVTSLLAAGAKTSQDVDGVRTISSWGWEKRGKGGILLEMEKPA